MLKKVCVSLLSVVSLTGVIANGANPPQNATTPASHPPMLFSAGTPIRVELDKTIDAKKAKVGDEVTGKTTDDLNSNPPGLAAKGCKVVGHVAEVTPHQGSTASTLGIAFDKLVLKDGSEMPLNANIQAIGFADTMVDANNDQTITKMGGNVGTSQPGGTIGSGGGQPSGYGGQRMPSNMPSNPDAKLPWNAKGAVGMAGVSLGTGASKDSLLTSDKHNVKIEHGMQMILHTQ